MTNAVLYSTLDILIKSTSFSFNLASFKYLLYILEKYNLIGIFDLILTHEDVTKSKPDPEGYIKAMQFFNVQPDQCIIFEDSDTGIQAAEKSGVQYMIVKGYN